jgi:YVTN family beta-propeller protein
VSHDGGKVYVVNSGNNSVSVIDTAHNTVSATIPVGTDPQGVAVSHDGGKVYVVNSGDDNVSVIGTARNTVTATIPVGRIPTGISISMQPTRNATHPHHHPERDAQGGAGW